MRACLLNDLRILGSLQAERSDMDRFVASCFRNSTVFGEIPASARNRMRRYARRGCTSS